MDLLPADCESWEIEIAELLQNCSTDDAELICKAAPFRDTQVPCCVLAGRPIAWLHDLSGRRVNVIEKPFMATQIFFLLRQTVSVSLKFHDWKGVIEPLNTSVTTIANRLNTQLCSWFSSIPLNSWLQHALGCRDTLVLEFLGSILSARNYYVNCLTMGLIRKDQWELISKELETKHPLAFWMVSSCLNQPQSYPDETLSFLLNPIQEFFRRNDGDLIRRLKQLASLAKRFQCQMTEDQDWSCPFSTDYSFWDGIDEPEKLAESMVEEDCRLFRQFSFADFEDHQSELHRTLWHGWRTLTIDVTASVTSDTKFLAPVMRLAENFYHLKNYRRTAAVSYGLVRAGFSWSEEEWPIWKIISPEDNFSGLMDCSKSEPSLPLLPWASSLGQFSVEAYTRMVGYEAYFEEKQRSKDLLGRSPDDKPTSIEILQFQEFIGGWLEEYKDERPPDDQGSFIIENRFAPLQGQSQSSDPENIPKRNGH